jgi:deazaflavin-dependent oxidoreductase (nitroreductase family)
VYIQDGQDYVVSATAGGSDWDPGWYLNLKTRPEAMIEVGDVAFEVQATIAQSEERARLYEKFKTASKNFVKYEHSTSRVLPVIRLTPTHISREDT